MYVMIQQGIHIGEFEPFVEGYEVAELSGASLKRCVGILGTRPPFRDAHQADELDFDAYMQARRMATTASRTMDVAVAAAEADHSIETVVFSRTGALAIRGGDTVSVSKGVIDLISYLDGGNAVVTCLPHPINIG